MTGDAELEGFEPADLDGHTIDELSDYLAAGRQPLDPSIESSPGCQIALDAMLRLKGLSLSLLESDVAEQPATDESFIAGILNSIGFEAQSGRNIPVQHPSAHASLTLTEGAVRGLIRAAGDTVSGVLIGRCVLQGEVSIPGEPISVLVDASVFWGESIPLAAARIREAIYAELLKHTELNIVAIDVTIHDVHLSRSLGEQSVEEIE
ncbi:hypothetical protein B7R54_18110 [Subtercola boreus]|uniref:Asp23/Gls24 family envelope stress response protein n=1 Tax=Subtercola boreus TaxID=120213 RepID=A0A3E0VPW8_9MICO|nr:Asp23/Gls24 family envelope stress response protein [Subtercola boreus]RFA10907.1 hypothetical protein B7R54_18110 [Subtercola boreus]TQL55502.1 hypothetical protein FB464_3068 [Subtercola boreus]